MVFWRKSLFLQAIFFWRGSGAYTSLRWRLVSQRRRIDAGAPRIANLYKSAKNLTENVIYARHLPIRSRKNTLSPFNVESALPHKRRSRAGGNP